MSSAGAAPVPLQCQDPSNCDLGAPMSERASARSSLRACWPPLGSPPIDLRCVIELTPQIARTYKPLLGPENIDREKLDAFIRKVTSFQFKDVVGKACAHYRSPNF